MPLSECVDVRIEVGGKTLTEYPEPDNADDSHHDVTRYVEVKTGQTFAVVVKILPGFETHLTPYLRVTCDIDQNTGYFLPSCSCKDGAIIIHGRLSQQPMKRRHARRQQEAGTGAWYTYLFGFRALGLSEIESCPPIVLPSDLEKLGSLRVSVFRAKQKKLVIPSVAENTTTIDELPEKALKGKALQNNVKLGTKAAIAAPEPEVYDYVPINGVNEQAYNFVFRYRNRKILQNLGCIPRSPSLELDPAIMLEHTEDMLRVSKQRVREQNLCILALEARLAGVACREHGIDVAYDARNGNSTPGIKNEVEDYPSQGHPKRSRSATVAAGEDDDLMEMAPLPKKTPVFIDLTDD